MGFFFLFLVYQNVELSLLKNDISGKSKNKIIICLITGKSLRDSLCDPQTKCTGTVWTAFAHIITAVIGTGVLSLAWSMSQLGWIAGPLTMLAFASVTLVSMSLLSHCYKSPDPNGGFYTNGSYMNAVGRILGKKSVILVNSYVGKVFVSYILMASFPNQFEGLLFCSTFLAFQLQFFC